MKYFQFFLLTVLLASWPTCAENYQVAQIATETYSDTIERTGTLTFQRVTQLSFKNAGYLMLLSVDEGQYFKKDTLLASLDTAELIEDKNAKYAQLLQAKRDVRRLSELLKRELSAKQALDDAKTRLETTRAAYKVSYYNLEKSQLRAPFDGIVLKRNTVLGELQAPGQTALTVAALRNNWVVRVALTEREIAQVQLQQAVSVRLNHQRTMSGVISKIPALADSNSHLFTIEITLPEFEYGNEVIAGQLAGVSIAVQDGQQVYKVPVSALIGVDEFGDAMVLTQQDGATQQQSFAIYRLDSQYIYLLADEQQEPLQVVVQGWQNLLVKGQ